MAERLAAPGVIGRTRASLAPESSRAALGARLLAYLLDSVVLFAFTMLFAATAFSIIFFSSDYGQQNPGDDAFSALAIVLLATMPSWLALNVILSWKRGQTVGHYVLGLRLLKEDEGRPNLKQVLVYWLALHPLFFHPLFASFWLLITYYTLESGLLFVGSLAIALLSFVGPLAALLFALADPQHRTLHDRLAGTKLVRLSR